MALVYANAKIIIFLKEMGPMKNRFTSLVLGLILVVAMSIPTFAAGGVNSNEQALLDSFTAVVTSQPMTYPKAGQYITEATNALIQVDLDAAACADLQKGIEDVAAILSSNSVGNGPAARSVLPQVLTRVNSVANKYGMNVSVVDARGAANDGVATVTVTVPDGGNGGSQGGSGSSGSGSGTTTKVASTGKIVNQTGFDMTATMAVAVLLLAAFAGSIVVISKKNLLAK